MGKRTTETARPQQPDHTQADTPLDQADLPNGRDTAQQLPHEVAEELEQLRARVDTLTADLARVLEDKATHSRKRRRPLPGMSPRPLRGMRQRDPAKEYIGEIAVERRVRVELRCDADSQRTVRVLSAGDVFELFAEEYRKWDRERLFAVGVDARGNVLGIEEVARGSRTTAPATAAEIFKGLFLQNAAAWYAVHNHPDGHAEASPSDLKFTNEARVASAFFGVPLHDHVVLGTNGYFSFRERLWPELAKKQGG